MSLLNLSIRINPSTMSSSLEVGKRIKQVSSGFGLIIRIGKTGSSCSFGIRSLAQHAHHAFGMTLSVGSTTSLAEAQDSPLWRRQLVLWLSEGPDPGSATTALITP